MNGWKCPMCGEINHESLIRCFCGYEEGSEKTNTQIPKVKQEVLSKEAVVLSNPQKVRNVGLSQRLLLWAVLASILVFIVPDVLPFALLFQFYCIYRLLNSFEISKPKTIIAIVTVSMIAVFVPFGNLFSALFLLLINGKATRYLRENGISVGLMGAKPSTLPAAES